MLGESDLRAPDRPGLLDAYLRRLPRRRHRAAGPAHADSLRRACCRLWCSCGLVGLATAAALLLMPSPPQPGRTRPLGRPAAGAARESVGSILTPTVLGLTAFFTLMSLSPTAPSQLLVVALIATHGLSFTAANAALTAYPGRLRVWRAGGRYPGRQDPPPRRRGGHRLRRSPLLTHARRVATLTLSSPRSWWPWAFQALSSASFSRPATCWCAGPRRRARPAACSASSRPASTSAASSGRCCSAG